jgi:serine/threonine-protein kinase
MAEVLEAQRAPGEAPVVVKLLHRHLAARRDLADRLRLEGEALACVSHPNVVAALDRGVTPEGRAYLVLERLHGRTLREEIALRGALPPEEAAEIVAQALDGLAAVHAAGVVHRDVKLENLFLCDAGSPHGRAVKLLDLGLAKLVGPGRPAPLLAPTAEDVTLGTPRFFSPEQAIGAPLDGRADVYAAGLVLYALLTGRVPFEHLTDVAALLEAHATEDPPPPSRLLRAPLHPALEEVVLRALAKHPDDRFAGAAEFAAELRAAAHPPPGPLRAFALALSASLVLSMIGSAIARWLLR